MSSILQIVLVEDEPWIRQAIVKMIQPLTEFVVISEAGDGVQGLELVQKQKPDILLTDVKMPGMGGLVLAAEARKLLPRLEIVIFSGYNEFDYVRDAMRQGVHDYLLKPVQPQELTRVLYQLASKLKWRSSELSERLAWMDAWHGYAKQLAACMWRLEKQPLEQIWQQLTCEWLRFEHRVDVYDFYQQLIYTLNEELRTRYGGKLPEHCFHPLAFTGQAQTDAEMILKRLYTILDEWQIKRNWSRSHAVTKAVGYIQQSYQVPDLSLQAVADFANVSSSYLSRSFKEEMGKSFVEYITEVRMEKAKRLLADSDIRIYEVAEHAGYPVYAYFSRVFKKMYGQSPTAYRLTLGIHERDHKLS